MTPIAQLIAELREHVEFAYVPARLRDAMERAAEAIARQEELLAEAGKVLEELSAWATDFRAAARLSDKLKGE